MVQWTRRRRRNSDRAECVTEWNGGKHARKPRTLELALLDQHRETVRDPLRPLAPVRPHELIVPDEVHMVRLPGWAGEWVSERVDRSECT